MKLTRCFSTVLLACALVTGAARAEPDDPGAAREWTQLVQLFEQQLTSVNDADRRLSSFAAANKLTAVGKARTKALSTKLDGVRQQLQSSLDAARLLAKRPKSTLEDAARFRKANEAVLAEAVESVAKERAAENDVSLVDRSAEEAQARKEAAERARAEQAAARRDAEQRRIAEVEERRRAEEERRRSQVETQRRAEEERRAQAAAAAAGAKAEVDARLDALDRATRAQAESARAGALLLSTFLARPNVTIDARGAAARLQRRLESAASLDKRVAALRAMPVAQARQAAGGVQAEVERQGRDIAEAVESARSLVNAPKSYLTGTAPAKASLKESAPAASPSPSPPPPPVKLRIEDVIPMCELAFEPTADAKGVLLGIDGAPPKPLPARIRVASGRHVLTVKKDKVSQERRELLLCGHISVVPIDAPK